MSNTDERKVIAILGAGFGGLHCALMLGRHLKKFDLVSKYRVLLVDQNDYHTYMPTLYEAATTSDEIASQIRLKSIITFPIHESIEGLPVEFFKTRVTEIDLPLGDIHTETGTVIHFNYLVLALGSQTNYFGIPGMHERSLPLKTFIDALRIREHLMMLAEDTEQEHLQILVGGGGSAGVELAGEINAWLKSIHYRLPSTVSIIEATPTVMGPFDPRIASRVTRRLQKIGVQLLTNERIQSVGDGIVTLASGKEIPFDALIWTGGVIPNQIMSSLKVNRDEKNRVVVDSFMRLSATGVYAIGDAISAGVARAAITQANIVSNNIISEITSKIPKQEYHARTYPYVIPVGGKYAIAKIGPFIISGFFAWAFKGCIELYYLVSVLPFHKALKTWLRGLWIFTRNDRLG